MTQQPPSLQDLRREIDSIDEQVHELLMKRGDIIDRLISVKKTQEVGSAFRPAREADLIGVAPATADLMAKLAQGLAGDLASTLLMATDPHGYNDRQVNRFCVFPRPFSNPEKVRIRKAGVGKFNLKIRAISIRV